MRTEKSINKGFTVVELMIVIFIFGLIATAMFTFMNTSFSQYLKMQKESYALGDLSVQTQRLAKVIRGLSDISQASANEITLTAYFSPQDQVVSQVRFYRSPDGSKLYIDQTPYTANPPYGTLLTAQKKTTLLIDNLNYNGSTTTFRYLDSAFNELPSGFTNLKLIKGVEITLTSKNSNDTSQLSMTTKVALRNRKTNL